MISGIPSVIALQGVGYAFAHSDLVGQFIVIFLLFGSVLTWTIMLDKGLALHRAMKLSEYLVSLTRNSPSIFGLYRNAANNPSPIAQVYMAGIQRLMEFEAISPEQVSMSQAQGIRPRIKLTEAQLSAIHTALEREVADQIMILEKRIGVLGTAVSVSPFFGLFGTVWGIMLAFTAVAAHGSANIGALAPGVSGALLTTVVGLVVAIPSLIGYNLLTVTIRKLTVYMDNFTEEFIAKVKLEQLEHENLEK
ncbi:MAG: MotA/TolQ/ExbB proton channel family protein [Victivallales bacterium]|nr:MotA/TolQ/ExbB proton channel family protein [Victivallales bacterium]